MNSTFSNSSFHFHESDAQLSVIGSLINGRTSLIKWSRWIIPATWLFLETYRFWRVQQKLPRDVNIPGGNNVFGHLFYKIWFSWLPGRSYRDAYAKNPGNLWAVPLYDRYIVCAPEMSAINDLSNASIYAVSPREAVHEFFPPLALYGGMPIGDIKGNSGLAKMLLSNNLKVNTARLLPAVRRRMLHIFETSFVNQPDKNGWQDIALHHTLRTMVTRLNTLIIVGEKLSTDPTFETAVLKYLTNATIAEEVMRMIPEFGKLWIGSAIVKLDGSWRVLIDAVTNQLKERLPIAGNRDNQQDQPQGDDLAYWTIQRTRNAAVDGMAYHILGLIFSAAHQMPMLIAFAMWRLCAHPEYVEPLREEAQRCMNEDFSSSDNMPLLDSFLREVARMHPITRITIPHKVVQPFTFSSGAHVPEGNYVSVTTEQMMRNPNVYSSPDTFQGFRFVDFSAGQHSPVSKTRLTQTGWDYPFWGHVKHACPGRFWASTASKMMLAHFLTEYDFRLKDVNSNPEFCWGWSVVFHPTLKIQVRKRAEVQLY